jgi:hypothetical protein
VSKLELLRLLEEFEGEVELADFSLLLFLDSVINNGAPAEIPWKTFR